MDWRGLDGLVNPLMWLLSLRRMRVLIPVRVIVVMVLILCPVMLVLPAVVVMLMGGMAPAAKNRKQVEKVHPLPPLKEGRNGGSQVFLGVSLRKKPMAGPGAAVVKP